MKTFAGVTQLVHPALRELCGPSLADARLTDRERLGVVLQAAALGSHLELSSWHLVGGWSECRVDGDQLCASASPGASSELPQAALSELLKILFAGPVSGRGEARRSARALQRLWRQRISPVPYEELVRDVFEEAPFLWSPAFAAARAHLVGQRWIGDAPQLWIAAPSPFRHAVLSIAPSHPMVISLLAEPWVGDLWRAALGPRALDPVQRALTWRSAGRLLRAADELRDLPAAGPALLRARCLLEAGETKPATAILDGLDGSKADLLPEQRRERQILLAEVGLASGKPDAAEISRLLAESEPDAPISSGSSDRLAALRAWAARSNADHRGVEAAWAGALRHGAASLPRHLAGLAWLEIGRARVACGRLRDAERAFRHAVRRLRGCDGARRDMDAVGWWLEVAIRRGRLREAGENLDLFQRSADRAATETPAPALLAIRMELACGRAHAALDRCETQLSQPSRSAACAFHALAARALGWLGRGAEAAQHIQAAGTEGLDLLEPEERVSVLAHAGRRDAAYAAAAQTVAGQIWAAVLTGMPVPAERWSDLRKLERYRAGRVVHDISLLDAQVVPVYWRRRAASDLRRAGAFLLAERIEALDSGAWSALEDFLATESVDGAAICRLLTRAGYGETRVELHEGEQNQVLCPGFGGGESLETQLPGARLVLTAPIVDPTLRALFALLGRDLRDDRGDPDGPGAGRRAQTDPTGPLEVAGPRMFDGLVGESAGLRSAVAKATALAQGEMPVLLHGESGTGKELFARGIHRRGRRSAAPFLALNCAALSESLLLSDLFGHVRGSFTGADRDRSGVFESARGGTVFLDEIGDLPPVAQGMLLRVLQEREVRRVGESLARRIDVRVVAATHRDLAQMVRAGTFRQDLFFRLAVAVVELPPLRERADDVVLIAESVLQRIAPDRRLTTRARAMLLGHSWPGNVRELENVLAVATTLTGGLIEPRHLELPVAPADSTAERGDYHQRVESFRRRLIEEALDAASGNRSEAARRLGLSRQALSYLSQQMGLQRRR